MLEETFSVSHCLKVIAADNVSMKERPMGHERCSNHVSMKTINKSHEKLLSRKSICCLTKGIAKHAANCLCSMNNLMHGFDHE